MISPRELANIRHQFDRHLNDTAVHLRRSDTTGTFGEQIATFNTAGTYRCGFAFSPFKFRSRERGDEIGEQVGEIYIRARFSSAVQGVIDSDDRIVLVKQFGKELSSPAVFEVQGFEELTIGGLIINLRRVEI